MPEKEQEIARFQLQTYSEEGILAGIGVLLLFLGVWSDEPMTNVFSFGIGVFLFYTAYSIHHSKRDLGEVEPIDRDFREPPEEIERELFSEQVAELSAPEPEVKPPVRRERTERTFHASDFVETASKRTMSIAEPQNEFNDLLLKALSAVKEVCFAHTAAFFWVNPESRQLVLEAKISDSGSFLQDRKIPIGNDAVSRIGMQGEPEMVNDISSDSEREIVRYYTSLQDVRSFIGVPVFYADDDSSRRPVAVIGVDSKAQDAFGEETFSILAKFSKLISAMLASYTEKYDLLGDSKLLEAESRLQKKIANRPNLPLLVNSFLEELELIVPWDSLSVILFDEAQRQWTIASARTRTSERFVAAKQPIDFEKSLAGNAIRTSLVMTVDLSKNSETVFHSGETKNELLRQGTMMIVPFTSNGKCFGAVTVGDTKSASFGKKESRAVQNLSSILSAALEIVELNAIITEHVVVDELTGTLTRKYFRSRIEEELHRATDRTEDLSLVFVSIAHDADIETRYGREGKNAALVNIAQQLRASVREYDIVARYDETTFALVLADTVANDAFLWAEKLRGAIASTIIHLHGKSFSVSVTIGVSGAAARMTGDELIKNALYVLDQAKRAGGNIVRVF